jgi:hypothetical protein
LGGGYPSRLKGSLVSSGQRALFIFSKKNKPETIHHYQNETKGDIMDSLSIITEFFGDLACFSILTVVGLAVASAIIQIICAS